MKPAFGDDDEKIETIRITERDVHQEVLTCIDPDRDIWVVFGFPMNVESGTIDRNVMRNLEGPPYVFVADTMDLVDNKHPQGVRLENVRSIFMHGGREGDGPWMFSSLDDGYPVVETVRAVNGYLVSKGESPIQVIMACNESPSPYGIKVGDFASSEHIVYAVGETVGLRSAGMSEDGKIHFSAQAGDFWGLDDLIVSQQIKIL